MTVSKGLPKYKNPPVVETVLGVQFEPLSKCGNAHLGAFWKKLGGDWPNVNDAPCLDPQFEQFSEEKSWLPAGFQLKVSQDTNTRLQIRNGTNDRMIQVQNGRLLYNWLGHEGKPYPNFEEVEGEFNRALDAFGQFMTAEEIGELRPNQWEVTYVNHIPVGTVWNDPCDWVDLFPSLAALPSKTSSVRLESFGGQWHYEIAPKLGRLHVNLAHGWRKTPSEQEMLVLKLTARGPVKEDDLDGVSLNEGLCIAHKAIVQSFTELTSDKAHQYWGLIHDET
jgi:uncharacterized protein (TIGR04255 family)